VRNNKLIAITFQNGAPAKSIMMVSPQIVASLIIVLLLGRVFSQKKIFKNYTWKMFMRNPLKKSGI